MKLLFVRMEQVANTQSFFGQLLGAEQLGHETHCIYVEGGELVYYRKKELKRLPLPENPKRRDSFICGQICRDIEENHYDMVYLRADLVNRWLLKIAKWAKVKSFDAKVIFEATSYFGEDGFQRRLQEIKKLGDTQKYKSERKRYFQHLTCLFFARDRIDTVVVFGKPVERVWRISATGLERGITVSNIAMRTKTKGQESPVSLIGVIDYPKYCGFDRVIKGMALNREKLGDEGLTFDIVGDPETTVELKKLVEEEGLGEYVHFLGNKTDEELNGLWNGYSLGISELGLYSGGLEYASPRNLKLYSAAGLPFVYAFENLSLQKGTPFAIQVANDDAPVNTVLLSEFTWRCRLDARLAQTERKFADRNYDWRVIMKRLFEFTLTGRREG